MPIIHGNCLEQKIENVDLIFADPPFNIGVNYNNYDDNRSDYRTFTVKWIRHCISALKETGSLYIAIPDEHVAMVYNECVLEGLIPRNWIIWYYTFGQNCRNKFARSKTHILYFVKGAKFTFNPQWVESERQRLGDSRAASQGKVDDDVWFYSRVCGTFKERLGHPCQMPESVLERIILTSSNKGDLVYDPFGGTGTTAAVAKKLLRDYIIVEQSSEYVNIIRKRLL